MSCVRVLAKEPLSRGGVWLAVSLDISNAFKPPYLLQIFGDYLLDRCVNYMGRDDGYQRRMSCSVSQGSPLGPLLWNIGYDLVVRSEHRPVVDLKYNAYDDTWCHLCVDCWGDIAHHTLSEYAAGEEPRRI